MIYPRLKLARNLLMDEGIVFISIDENELDNLKKICNEIFGEENFRNLIAVRRYDKNLNLQFIKNGLKTMNIGLEYILVYTKSSKAKLHPVFKESNNERAKKGYWKGFWNNANRPTMRYDILGVTPTEGQWKWKKEVAYEAIKNYDEYLKNYSNMSLEEYWKSTGYNKKFIRRKISGKGKNKGVEHWISPSEGILRNSNWSDILISKNNTVDIPFDSPKNINLIMELISLSGIKNDELILDFFSGSASTAEAVIQLNDDGRKCNFIMVQIPELTDEKSEAYKAGYKNICEIGKERIRRAGDKILEESDNKDLDIGFKVFKLDSSNLEKWNPDYNNLEQTLLTNKENIKPDRTELDLIYEIMLKYGIDLMLPIEKSNNIYSIGYGALLICLEDNITKEIANEIIELKSDNITRVVFKESGFKSDADKTNIKETLRINNIDEFITI